MLRRVCFRRQIVASRGHRQRQLLSAVPERLEPRAMLAASPAPSGIDPGTTGALYWNSGGSIWRSQLDGTGREVAVAPPPGRSITTFDIDKVNNRIYFAHEQLAAASNSTIQSVDLNGGDRRMVYEGAGLGRISWSMTVDPTGGYVFLHSHDVPPVQPSGPFYEGKIQRVTIATGAVTVLPTTFWYVHDMQVSSNAQLYVAGFSDFFDASSRFYVQQRDGTGNREISVANVGTLSFALAERSQSVYVSAGSERANKGDIFRAPLSGGTPTLVFDGTSAVGDIEFDDETSLLYWITDDGRILRSNAAGGDVQTIVSGISSGARDLAVVMPPPALTVSEASATKNETDSGSTSFTFTVTRSGSTAGASAVTWAVAGSGASPANADDFAGGVLPSGTLSFAAGESTKTITVGVRGDTIIEPDEGFTVSLSSPTGATLGSPFQATGTIRNDDFPTVTITAVNADKPEGTGSGPTPFTFTVTRPSAATGAASFAWAVTGSGVDAADAADFAGGVLPSGILAFAAAETSKTIAVNVSADGIIEVDEGFTVSLSSPTGAALGVPVQATGTIRNDDFPAVTIVASAANNPEGTGGGPTVFTFMVTRQSGFAGSSTVAWSVAGSGPKPANAADFTGGVLPSGTVSFAAGETSKTITVNVAADGLVEADEGFTVTLSSPTGATLGVPAQASGTIRNDDIRSRLSIAATDAVKSEGDIGRTPFTFTLTRTGDLSGVVSVPWSIVGSGLNQADRLDFIGGVLPSGTIRLAPGRQTQTLIVNVLCDRIAEFDEQFTITLGTPLGGLDTVEAGLSSAAATIRNDDPGTPRPAAVTPAQGRSIVGLAAGNGLATNQVIVAQAFAMLADTSGSAGTNTTKRIAVAIRA